MKIRVRHILLAILAIKGLNIARGFVAPGTFPLPTFSQRLEEISREIHEGRGFCLLRGLETEKYSDEDNIILFAGVASHVGSRRCIEGNGLAMSKSLVIHIWFQSDLRSYSPILRSHSQRTRWFPKSKLGPSKRPGAMVSTHQLVNSIADPAPKLSLGPQPR